VPSFFLLLLGEGAGGEAAAVIRPTAAQCPFEIASSSRAPFGWPIRAVKLQEGQPAAIKHGCDFPARKRMAG